MMIDIVMDVVVLKVIMLNVVKFSVIIPSVVAPKVPNSTLRVCGALTNTGEHTNR